MTDTQTTTIGRFRLTAIVDGFFTADPAFIAGAGTREARDLRLGAGLPPDDHLSEPVNAFALERDGKFWLIDAGVGRDAAPDFGRVAAGLTAMGRDPESVDTIIVTHLHEDHVGGLVENGVRTYPNARLIVPERDVRFWTDPVARVASGEPASSIERALLTLDRYRGMIDTVEDDGEIAGGLRFRLLPGHTPGHSGVMIENGTDRLLMWADITHSSLLQLTYPHWTIDRDLDPAMAAATRKALLAELAGSSVRVGGSHHVGFGHIVRAGEGYRFDPTTTAPPSAAE